MSIEQLCFEQLWKIISKSIQEKIASHKGLKFFVCYRSKFEDWLKVELIEILADYTSNIEPEKDRIDIVVDNTLAIELKTVNTSYKSKDVVHRTKPITNNVKGVINDINKLKNNSIYCKGIVVFIVFPLPEKSEKYWKIHETKIRNEVSKLKTIDIKFANKIRGKFYIGLVK